MDLCSTYVNYNMFHPKEKENIKKTKIKRTQTCLKKNRQRPDCLFPTLFLFSISTLAILAPFSSLLLLVLFSFCMGLESCPLLLPCGHLLSSFSKVRNLGKPVDLAGKYYNDGADEVCPV